MTRPDPKQVTNGAELRRWYWEKAELVALARHHGVKTSGGKFQILDRVCHFLETGEHAFPGDVKVKATSKFDWHREDLTPETLITDNYRNTQNVRRFLEAHVGAKITFKTDFMAWMKANIGKTMNDAIEAYLEIMQQTRQPGFESRIADHNQFNQYTRDFLKAHPEASIDDVRFVWGWKRMQPSEDGRHRFEAGDWNAAKGTG